jgi:predicted YcjX-like family ATPase
MGIGSITDTIARAVEDASDGVTEVFQPVIRVGVTGLSRAGKTVFITSLVANLLDRGRMPQLLAASEGRIVSAFLQPQPDDTVPRFAYETHLAALTGAKPHWPHSTRAISQLRLSLKVQPRGMMAGMRGLKTVHIDIVDYPGEWLLDLPLLTQSYAEWSTQALDLARSQGRA